MTSDNAAAREIVSRFFYPRVGKLDAQTENQASEAIAEALKAVEDRARQEGRREGLEEAARVAEKQWNGATIAAAIRALAGKE